MERRASPKLTRVIPAPSPVRSSRATRTTQQHGPVGLPRARHDAHAAPSSRLTTDYDGARAPYAAAVVVETWTLPGGSDAVRVAYDGTYRTPPAARAKGCAPGRFLAATGPGARDRDCSAALRAGSLRVDAGDAPAPSRVFDRRVAAGALPRSFATRGCGAVDPR